MEFMVAWNVEGGVGEAKRHDEELVMPFVHPKVCFVDIVGVNTDLVVSRAKVKFGKEAGCS